MSYRYIFLLDPLFFTAAATTQIYTLSLHDALPISRRGSMRAQLEFRSGNWRAEAFPACRPSAPAERWERSEEHTSELQSRENLVCRLLLEKKKEVEKG